MIKYIHTDAPDSGAKAMTDVLMGGLRAHKKVLWLICGGSNIPTAVDVIDDLQQELSYEEIRNLTIIQTDERYGPVGHSDSNWQQMLDLNFNHKGVQVFPVLRNLSLEETISEYGKVAESAFHSADVIIGQFGIGPDGHIAGILPNTKAVTDTSPTSGYEAKPFTRITLTPSMLEKIQIAFVFAFGSSKREAIMNLKNNELSLAEEPAQILKRMAEVNFYTDQI